VRLFYAVETLLQFAPNVKINPGAYLLPDDDFKPDLNALRLKNRPVIPDFSGFSESTGSAKKTDLQDVLITQDGKDITPPR
jgi:hypothetical protein